MSGALPEQCCSILPSTGELIVIKRGERGYYRSEWNTDSREENKNIADFTNSRMGITLAQLEAMICGSMCGWDVPGAQPQFYLDRASKEKSVAHHRPHQTSRLVHLFPSEGETSPPTTSWGGCLLHRLFLYAQDDDGRTAGLHLHPNLVTRELMIPVSYQQGAKRKLYPVPGERLFPSYHGTI